MSENEEKLCKLGFVKTSETEEKVSFNRMRSKNIEMIHFIRRGNIILRDTLADAAEDREISKIIELLEKEYFKDEVLK